MAAIVISETVMRAVENVYLTARAMDVIHPNRTTALAEAGLAWGTEGILIA